MPKKAPADVPYPYASQVDPQTGVPVTDDLYFTTITVAPGHPRSLVISFNRDPTDRERIVLRVGLEDLQTIWAECNG